MYHPKFTYIVHQLLTIIYLFGFYVELAEPVLLRAEYQRLLDALGTFVEEVIIDITEKILFIQHGLYFFWGGGRGGNSSKIHFLHLYNTSYHFY